MQVRFLAHRSWPELIFHVLAHVEHSRALPSSLFDPIYVGWAEERFGPAAERMLAEDAEVLGRALSTHEALAAAQLLAWLFDDVAQAGEVAKRDLSQLKPEQVARPELLGALVGQGAPIEVLRCAAELERSVLSDPMVELDDSALDAALARVAAAAPGLPGSDILCLRALRLRGRVRGAEIWVGLPSAELQLSVDHVAWQAAHEATVREVGARVIDERRTERVALVLLAERARRIGLADGHARWLGHLEGPPCVDRAHLDEEGRSVVGELLG